MRATPSANSRLLQLVSLAAVLALALPSCETVGDGPSVVASTTDAALRGNVSVETLLACKNPVTKMKRGRKIVRFDLINTSSKELEFSWAVDWFDRRGTLLHETERRWRSLTLAAEDSTSLEIVGPSAQADSWKLHAVRPWEIR